MQIKMSRVSQLASLIALESVMQARAENHRGQIEYPANGGGVDCLVMTQLWLAVEVKRTCFLSRQRSGERA